MWRLYLGPGRAAGARGPPRHGRPDPAGQRVVVRAAGIPGRADPAARRGRHPAHLPRRPGLRGQPGGHHRALARPERRRAGRRRSPTPCWTMAVERRAGDRGFLAWEYYDVADDPSAMRPGTSGMAQARVALVLADADRRHRRPALRRGGPRRAGGPHRGRRPAAACAAWSRWTPRRRPMPWYVERAYPGESPWKGAALNGFMVSITNLRGTAALLRLPTADPSPSPPPRPPRRRSGRPGRRHARPAPARPRHRRLEPTTACSPPDARGAPTWPTSTTTATTCACSPSSPSDYPGHGLRASGLPAGRATSIARAPTCPAR